MSSTFDGLLVYGLHSLKSVFDGGRRKLIEVLVLEDCERKIPQKIKNSCKVRVVSKGHIENTLKLKHFNHQGVIGVCSKRSSAGVIDFKSQGLVLVLNNLTDIGNIGAIIRSCVCFGVKTIITNKTGMPDLINNPEIIKTSAGLSEFVDVVQAVNLKKELESLQKTHLIIATQAKAQQKLHQFAPPKGCTRFAIVLGSEHKGIDPQILPLCQTSVQISMNKQAESLNVSASAAVFLYHFSSSVLSINLTPA